MNNVSVRGDDMKVLYRVISGSYSNKSNAEERIKQLKELGYNPIIIEALIDNKLHYRVQVGAFSNEENAKGLVNKLKSDGIKDAFLITVKSNSGNSEKETKEDTPIDGEPIMGKTVLTGRQMDAFALRINPNAPKLGDIYKEEAQKYGIRGDVAFAQAIHETGYFRFGGQVRKEQNNFAGLGATNDGASGASFKSGLKLALGENPKRIHSNSSSNDSITRMGIMGMLREAFYHAKNSDNPDDPRVSPIVAALKKEITTRVHAHRADDIMSAVRFAEEFDLDLRLEHCTEGHLIADELAKHPLQVTVGPTFTRRSKIELKNKTWDTYHVLTDNGINVSITTDHPYTPIQYLNLCASLAHREGLSEQKALEGITINPAKSLGVEHRVGSLETGKDADVVLWSHHPFHYLAKPVMTIINGEIIYKK